MQPTSSVPSSVPLVRLHPPADASPPRGPHGHAPEGVHRSPGVLPFEPGRSNLAIPEANGAGAWPGLEDEPSLPPPQDIRGILTDDEFEQYTADVEAFIAQLADVTAREVPPLPPAAPASCMTQLKGTMAAGAASYASTFMLGKLATNLISLWNPLLGAWSLPLMASPLHAVVGENFGGGVRANYGTYASPDGASWANFNTALGRLTVAQMSGNSGTISQCEADLDAVVTALTDRVDAEARKGTPLWSPSDDPMTSAAWRAFVTDELPYFAFAMCYTLTAAMAPYERAYLGGRDMSDKIKVAMLDFAASAVLGVAGGMGTAILQNALRPRVQHAPEPRGGLHSPAVREATKEQMLIKVDKLQQKWNTLKEMEDRLKRIAAERGLTIEEVAEQTKVQEALATNDSKLDKYAKILDGLESAAGRNAITVRRLFAANVTGKPKNSLDFLNGGPSQRRVAAKACGNVMALLPHVLMMVYVSTLAAHVLALDRLDPADGSEPDAQYVQDGIDAMIGPSVAAAWTLIGAWLTRSLWTPVIEGFLNHMEGVRRLVVQRGREPEVVIHTPPLSVPDDAGQVPEPLYEEVLDMKHVDRDDEEEDARAAHGNSGTNQRVEVVGAGLVKDTMDQLLEIFIELVEPQRDSRRHSRRDHRPADLYSKALKLAGDQLDRMSEQRDTHAERALVMDALAHAAHLGLFQRAGLETLFGTLPDEELGKIAALPVGRNPRAPRMAQLASEVLAERPRPSARRGGRPLENLRARDV